MESIYRFKNIKQAEQRTLIWDYQVHAVHLMIAESSMFLLMSMGISRSIWRLRSFFKRPLSFTDRIKNDQAMHVNGRLSIDPNSTSIDSLIRMQSPFKGSLGLYRKVEILSKKKKWLLSRHPYNQNEIKHSIFDPLPYKSYVTHKLESELFMNPSIRIQNFKVQDNVLAPMLQQDSDATRLPIDRNQIESAFQKKQNESIDESNSVEDTYFGQNRNFKEEQYSDLSEALAPYSFRDETKGKIIVDYDKYYIYLRSEKGKESTGDFRISYHDFGVLTDVTILGRINGDCIDQYYLENNRYQKDNKIQVERDGRIVEVNASDISFIVKGILDKPQMVKHVMKSIKNGRWYAKTFAWMVTIVALYAYLDNQMFYTCGEGNAVGKPIVRMNPETNEIEINHKSKQEYNPRNILSAALHLAGFLGYFQGFVSIGFVSTIAVLYNNNRFYNDHLEVLKQINDEINDIKSKNQGNDIPIVPEKKSFISILKQHFRLE